MRHHRGLRPGHVLTGVIRELGRTGCFLEQIPGIGRNRQETVLALLSSFPLDSESAQAEDHETVEAFKVSDDERGAKDSEMNIW